jgi:hypothetical protein
MPVILATQEAEIRRITILRQPRQIVGELLSQKHPSHKRAGQGAQVVGPEFKPQYHKTKKEKKTKKVKVVCRFFWLVHTMDKSSHEVEDWSVTRY